MTADSTADNHHNENKNLNRRNKQVVKMTLDSSRVMKSRGSPNSLLTHADAISSSSPHESQEAFNTGTIPSAIAATEFSLIGQSASTRGLPVL